ncbi:MAG: hypothetical protein ACREIP_20615 [Alphaproteobacteria bacterium]
MGLLRLLTLGFGAGAFGACVLVLVAYLLARFGVPEQLGITFPPRPMPAALYQAVVWGGIWGLLLVVPVMNRLWWLKGIIIGALATVALLLYFAPPLRDGPMMRLLYVLVLNAFWGVAAGFWWVIVSGARKNGRRFGTFVR